MSSKKKQPVIGQFTPMPRDLLQSDAMRSIGINEWRIIHFLLLEHMRHGGRENGNLKAPYRQLIKFGVALCYISAAIRKLEDMGLVRCRRGGMRVATTYGLTWLAMAGETAPTNDWRLFRNPEMNSLTDPQSKNLLRKGEAELLRKGEADGPNLLSKGEADGPKTLLRKGEDPSRRSNQGGGSILCTREGEGLSGERAIGGGR